MTDKRTLMPGKRSLEFRAQSFTTAEDGTKTVDVVFSTFEDVRRYDWDGDSYIERLAPEGMDLARLNAGAAVLVDHRAWSSEGQIGVVVEGTARMEDGVAVATVRFSRDEKWKGFVQDIEDGIRKSVSVGYAYTSYGWAEEDGVRILQVSGWQPYEISFVPIGADSGAKTRSFVTDTPQETTAMKVEETKVDPAQMERVRVAGILSSARKLGISQEKAEAYINDGIALDAARSMMIDARAEADKATETRSVGRIESGRTEGEKVAEHMGSALLARFDSRKFKLDGQNDFYGLSLEGSAREFLSRNGVSVKGMPGWRVAQEALSFRSGAHTTSDFGYILANSANKILRTAYTEAPQTWRGWARTTEVADFKTITRPQLSEGADLELIEEGGEIPLSGFTDAGESYSLLSYGKRIAITRQAIVNDDLGAFRFSEKFGAAAARKESDLVWGKITANAALSDTVALFHGDHANLGSAAAPSAAALGAMMAKIAKQVGPDGSPLDLRTAFVLAPIELGPAFEQIIYGSNNSTKSDSATPSMQALTLITDQRLSAASASNWYVAASPSQVDTIEVAFLQGAQGPRIETSEEFSTDGVQVRVLHDVGCGVLDHRGLAKNPYAG